MKKKKKNELVLYILIVIIIAFFIFLVFSDTFKIEKYLLETTNLSVQYPKDSTKIEVIKDDRDIVEEHVRFEINNRKFEGDLVVEFVITNSREVDCGKEEGDGSSSSSKVSGGNCEFYSRFEHLEDCEVNEKVSPYCVYYKEGFIDREQGLGPYDQRFGPVVAYFSRISDWRGTPNDFKGEWPEGKTRKVYDMFIMKSDGLESDKYINMFAWFEVGDEEAEKIADKMARYWIDVVN